MSGVIGEDLIPDRFYDAKRLSNRIRETFKDVDAKALSSAAIILVIEDALVVGQRKMGKLYDALPGGVLATSLAESLHRSNLIRDAAITILVSQGRTIGAPEEALDTQFPAEAEGGAS